MKNDHNLLAIKLLLPALPENLVPRKNLRERISLNQQARLISVVAPAGYGKSTLVNSWIHEHLHRDVSGYCASWYSIDQQDDDPAIFFSYFIRSLQQIDSGIGMSALHLLNLPKIPLEDMMISIINDLAEMQHCTTLVLDDYQYISDEAIHRSLTYLIDHLPQHVQLFIISREALPFPLHRLYVYGHLIEIGLPDLQFSIKETDVFLRDSSGLHISRDDVERIQRQTEGWAAGLQIAALSLKGKQQSPSKILEKFPQLIRENQSARIFFQEEVFTQQTDEIQTFFLKTAVLDLLTAPLCNEMAGIENSQEIITHLKGANGFLIPVDEAGAWYRYHSLFTDFLLSLLSDTQVKAQKLLASRWYRDQGLVEKAVQFAFSAGDFQTAGDLLMDFLPSMANQGDIALISSWLRQLPTEIVGDHPYLLLINKWMNYHTGKGNLGKVPIEQFATSASGGMPEAYPETYLTIHAELYNSQGQFDLAMQNIEAVRQMNPEEGPSTSMEIYAETLRLSGSYEAAIDAFRNSLRRSQQEENLLMEAFSIQHLSKLLYQHGQISEAIFLCEQFVSRHTDSSKHRNPMVGYGLIPLGNYYYEINQLDLAREHLEAGIHLCREIEMLKPIISGEIIQAKLDFLSEDFTNTRQRIFAIHEMAEDLGHIEYQVLAVAESAELELRMGNLAACERWLDSLDVNLDVFRRPIYEPLYLVYARLLSAKSKYQQAANLLLQLETDLLLHKRYGILIKAHLLQARNYQCIGEFSTVLEYIEKAVHFAETENYQRPFLDMDPELSPVLAVVQKPNPEFISRIIDEWSKSSIESSISTDFLKHFSDREWEIIQLLVGRLTNKEIANKLHISVGTTKWHLNNIYKKMGVKGRSEAVNLVNRINSRQPIFNTTLPPT